MSESNDLEDLFRDLSILDDEQAYEWGENYFKQNLIGRNGRSGIMQAHDGEDVKFFADRYQHAFRTSHDRARHAYSKAKVAKDRIERIQWIRPIIEGRVNDVECWEVPLKVPEEGYRCFPGKRLYISWEQGYIIWLEPLRKGGFKFSSCYALPSKEIARYIARGRFIWRFSQDGQT